MAFRHLGASCWSMNNTPVSDIPHAHSQFDSGGPRTAERLLPLAHDEVCHFRTASEISETTKVTGLVAFHVIG